MRFFFAEAFTRPKIMYRLAKLGLHQSYTYFTWRNSKQELTEYFTELAQPELTDIFRPNLWTNTPDILHDYLQQGGRPAFIVRAILAATLGAELGRLRTGVRIAGTHAARAGQRRVFAIPKSTS